MKSLLTALFLLLALAALTLAAEEPKQMFNVNEQLAPWRAYYDQQSPWPGHHGWKPFKRYEWDAIQRGWPDGIIPAAGLWEAYLQQQQMPHFALADTCVNLCP